MTSASSSVCEHSSLELPLCSRFNVVCFGSLWQAIDGGERGRGLTMTWAIGSSPQAPLELLGAWGVMSLDRPVQSLAMDDLWRRGVEHIALVLWHGPKEPTAESIHGRPKVGEWLDLLAVGAVSHPQMPRLAKTAAATDHAARLLHVAMVRARQRRVGSFGSLASARACLMQQWRRLQRQVTEDTRPPGAEVRSARSTGQAQTLG